MNCTLPDVQQTHDERGIEIPYVGISDVRLPLRILEKSGDYQYVTSTVDCYVSLCSTEKGTHMSRIISHIHEMSDSVVTLNLLEKTARAIKDSLKTKFVEISTNFVFFVTKKTPQSSLDGLQGYKCSFMVSANETRTRSVVGVTVPVITVCPCSREISEFGAHNQRAEICLRAIVNDTLWLEDLICALERQGSEQVYPILKRMDEKYVTEKSFENPKFTEDVLRDTVLLLRTLSPISGFHLRVNSYESIHPHNATAIYLENWEEHVIS